MPFYRLATGGLGLGSGLRVNYPFTASVGVTGLVVALIVDKRKPVLQPDHIHCFGGDLADQIVEYPNCPVFGGHLLPLFGRNRQIFGSLRRTGGANSFIQSIKASKPVLKMPFDCAMSRFNPAGRLDAVVAIFLDVADHKFAPPRKVGRRKIVDQCCPKGGQFRVW